MHNYFGFYVYDKKQIQITNGKWKNPYFKSSANDPNQWTKWTAYILPHEMFDHDKDGIANGQSFHTNGIDWIWPQNAKYVTIRFGSCYGTGLSHPDKTWYVFPSVKEITPKLHSDFLRDHHTVRTFDISNRNEWVSVPKYSGISFVNGKQMSY